MGDPRRQRRKYAKPTHLWRVERIEGENALIEKYGLKNKREIWRAQATINRVRTQAIRLQALSGVEADKEKNDLIERLNKTGLIKSGTLESILALKVEDLLERRLQTIVYRRGIAQAPKQARQLITHGHIFVGENVVTAPRYPVKVAEEDTIRLVEGVRLPEAKPKKTRETAEKTAEAAKESEPKAPEAKKESPESEPKAPEAKEETSGQTKDKIPSEKESKEGVDVEGA